MSNTVPLSSQRAYERIRREIISCALRPGAEISEPQLSSRFGFANAPVRAALVKLARDGLVHAVAQHGYRVTPVTVKDVHDLFELRLILEPPAARMAAGKVNTRPLRAHSEACRSGYDPRDPESVRRFLEAHQAFHMAVADAAGNGRLAHALHTLNDEMTRLTYLAMGLRNCAREIHQAQTLLLKAFMRADAELAERVSRQQIEKSHNLILSALLTSPSVMSAVSDGEAYPQP